MGAYRRWEASMQHAISNAGALESALYAAIDRCERESRAFDLRSDQLREAMTWSEIEDAMSEAPMAQRKEFWSQMLPLIDTTPRLIARQSVELIAGPLQEAVALAVDTKVRKEFDL